MEEEIYETEMVEFDDVEGFSPYGGLIALGIAVAAGIIGGGVFFLKKKFLDKKKDYMDVEESIDDVEEFSFEDLSEEE